MVVVLLCRRAEFWYLLVMVIDGRMLHGVFLDIKTLANNFQIFHSCIDHIKFFIQVYTRALKVSRIWHLPTCDHSICTSYKHIDQKQKQKKPQSAITHLRTLVSNRLDWKLGFAHWIKTISTIPQLNFLNNIVFFLPVSRFPILFSLCYWLLCL